MSSTGDEQDATRVAFERQGLADMRPAYRVLLRRLKARDEQRFAQATARYESELAPILDSEGGDPVGVWIEYGAWLAAQLGDGRLVAIDESGMASDATPVTPERGGALLFLPEADREPAIAIARPAEPSPAVAATLQLLVR